MLGLPFAANAAPLEGVNAVESNVSITLKFHYNEVMATAVRSVSYKTVAIRNANIIASLNAANVGEENYPFPSNARIIRKDVFDSDGDLLKTFYLLRKKTGEEADITAHISVELDDFVYKAKFFPNKNTSSYSFLATDIFNYAAEAGESEDEEWMVGAGLSRYNFKRIVVKGTEDFVDMLVSYNSRVGGSASLDVPVRQEGIVEGFIRVTGPKIVPISAPNR